MNKLLTEVCDIQYGFPFDSGLFNDSEGIPLIRIRDVKRGYSETYTTEEYCDDYVVNEGDILIGMDGEFNIAKWGKTPAVLNQRVCRVFPHDDVDSDYIFYSLPQELKKIEARTSFATVKHLSAKEINKIQIPVPSIEEQRTIAKKITFASNIITKRNRELEQLDLLIKARFVELFGNLRDEVTVEHYIAALTAGKSLAGEVECENKVLKTGAASFDYFDASQVKNLPIDYEPHPEHMVKAGDIIISRMNTAELTGATAYVWDVNENVYLPDRLWRAELKDNCNPIFVWQLLIQPSTKEQIRREASGTSGSMKNISKPALLGIRVIKVSFEQQNKFADFVTQVDKSKVAVQKALDETQLLFDSLMQEYFG
jgi:type I restriction enzyme S subunit